MLVAKRQPNLYELLANERHADRVVLYASAFGGLGYFEPDSALPFQTSPVFFRPEVLDKYKADPDKYRSFTRCSVDISEEEARYRLDSDLSDAICDASRGQNATAIDNAKYLAGMDNRHSARPAPTFQ